MTCATAVLPLHPVSVQEPTGSIRSFEGGEGDPVVLLHGLGGGASNWALVADGLVASRRVVALDLPGHGGSDPLPRGAGVDDYADSAAAAIASRVEAPAIVVGHSFGGQVALRLAERHPGLVQALLLVVSSGVAGLPRRTAMAGQLTSMLRPGRWVAPLAAHHAERVWFRTFAFRPFFVSDATALSARATLGFFAEVREHRGVRGAFRALLADDRGDEVAISCPALVLWGADDAIVPVEHGIVLARRLGAPLRLVPDCGHLLIAERPDTVLDAIGFLARQTGFSTSMNS